MGAFATLIDKLQQDYEKTMARPNGDACARFSVILEELTSMLREHIQGLAEGDIRKVIQKLQKREDLTPQDIEHLKVWIVGDADYYVKLENNVEDWKQEFNRVIRAIADMKNLEFGVEEAFRMQALLRDADRVMEDIFYYMEQKERVDHFNNAMQNLTPQDKELLVNLLIQKIKSHEY